VQWVNRHEWPVTKSEAYAIQEQRAPLVNCTGNSSEPELIAAVEVAYGERSEVAYAAAVVFTFPELREIERSVGHTPAAFPYLPGLFYFREGPALVQALMGLESNPDLIMISGHGIAHPTRCGMACHIGLDFEKPAIGCARRLLCGTHRPVDTAKGSLQLLKHKGCDVGVVYRSREGVKPIFVSPGHLCDLMFARDIVFRSLRGYRLPEPLRSAHLRAYKYKRYIEADQKSDPVAG
jgi:deoxyribonuclease V